jgi:transposase
MTPSPRRHELTEEQWQRLQPRLPPQKSATGRPNLDHRTTLNGILWILGTGAPWADFPERYGSYKTVSLRFYRWRKAGIWEQILTALQQDADAQGAVDWHIHYVNASSVRAHRSAAGAKGWTRKRKL